MKKKMEIFNNSTYQLANSPRPGTIFDCSTFYYGSNRRHPKAHPMNR